MRILPKANPLYEHIATGRTNLPDVLEKLAAGGFTGYLSHEASEGESCCVFARGKLICAVSRERNREKTGFEAISHIFDRAVAAEGHLNVYRMTQELAMCAHALLLGTRLVTSSEVRQIDVKGLLSRLKTQGLNGTVRFFTEERSATIFYHNGIPIGFYHDDSRTILASPDESRRVAALPGARVEVCGTRPVEELMQYDLLQMVNLGKLWEISRSRLASAAPGLQKAGPGEAGIADEEKLRELVDDLHEVATAYLSKAGKELIDRRLAEAGGPSSLLDSAKRHELLEKIGRDAAAIDSEARIDEMVDLMKSEIVGRLAV